MTNLTIRSDSPLTISSAALVSVMCEPEPAIPPRISSELAARKMAEAVFNVRGAAQNSAFEVLHPLVRELITEVVKECDAAVSHALDRVSGVIGENATLEEAAATTRAKMVDDVKAKLRVVCLRSDISALGAERALRELLAGWGEAV